ncbi:uncharacterized protein I303_102587 [Kwoniella dejecticola CBS 10117]|uniref:Helicase C-terminal domain-containing protein n=1 Tax=Kwoniella dejecticola CBS 10117 TaxID=1296121 RepID=A0AAJ8KKB6_9TREE
MLGKKTSIEVEQDNNVASGIADVTIASVQTLSDGSRLRKFNPACYGLVLLDEAHHAASPSWLDILYHFHGYIDNSSEFECRAIVNPSHEHQTTIIGFSATFQRMDRRNLKKAFGDIIHHAKKSSKGDYKIADLLRKVNTHEVNDLVVRMYKEKAANRKTTLVFCISLEHVADLKRAFIDGGVDARSVTGLMPTNERSRFLSDFGNDVFPVLLNVGVCTEGTDIPQCDCVILARPTKSPNLLVQMIGRCLRPSPSTDKTDCLVIDIVDNQSEIGSLDVIPDLWAAILEPQKENVGMKIPRPPLYQKNDDHAADDFKITYIEVHDPFGLNDDEINTVMKASKNAWVSCGRDHWVLTVIGKGYITVTRSAGIGQWKSVWQACRPFPPNTASDNQLFNRSPPRTVCQSTDLVECLTRSDEFVREHTDPDLYLQAARTASWRDHPTSETAIKALLECNGAKLGKVSLEELRDKIVIVHGKTYRVGGLTKGQVSSWLCAIFHGNKVNSALSLRTGIAIIEADQIL